MRRETHFAVSEFIRIFERLASQPKSKLRLAHTAYTQHILTTPTIPFVRRAKFNRVFSTVIESNSY